MRGLMKSHCRRVSVKYSVICATLGLAMALLLVLLMFGARGIAEMFDSHLFRDSAVTALVTLYAAAVTLGLVAGGLICRVGLRGPRVWLIGIGLAWCCLLLAVLVGSSMNFFGEMHNEPSASDAFTDWIFKPAFWVVLFGGLPASGLGLLYAAGVRKALGGS